MNNITLKEALSLIEFGNRPILLSDKNAKEYYYGSIYLFENSREYEKLSPLEVISVDASDKFDYVTFYLW